MNVLLRRHQGALAQMGKAMVRPANWGSWSKKKKTGTDEGGKHAVKKSVIPPPPWTIHPERATSSPPRMNGHQMTPPPEPCARAQT